MVNIKALVSYIMIIGIAVLYTLFLESQGGCYLITALVAAAVLSVLLCLYTKRTLTVHIVVQSDILNRGDTLTAELVFDKTGVLPSAFINTGICSSYHLASDSALTIKTAIFGSESVSFRADFRACYFGKARVGIDTVRVSDYLGMFSFEIPVESPVTEIKIYPDIPEVNAREGLARSLTDAAAFDDGEETNETSFSVNGTPGYDHRKYEPGDSLKYINWKISAKRGELYVRRLEGASASEQLFILDKAGSPLKDPNAARDAEQLAVEAMLGLMDRFIKNELPVKLMLRSNAEWETLTLTLPTQLQELRYRLTDYTFAENETARLPEEIKGRAVIFSARCDEKLYTLVRSGESLSAACDSAVLPADNIWIIKRDNDDIRFERS